MDKARQAVLHLGKRTTVAGRWALSTSDDKKMG
jgi:hypothetical protein